MHFTFCDKRPMLFTKSLWFHVSVNQCCCSAPVRAIYTSGGPRTVAARWLTYHPGPFRGRRGRGKTAGRHPWIPYGSRYIILTKIGKRNRAVPGSRTGPFMQPAGFYMGCLRATGLNKTPGELGAASLTHLRPYGLLKLSRRPRNRKGAGRAPCGNDQYIHFTRRTGPGSDLWKPLKVIWVLRKSTRCFFSLFYYILILDGRNWNVH